MGAAGVPLNWVCLLIKRKKKKVPREPAQQARSRAAWLCTHHTVDLLSGYFCPSAACVPSPPSLEQAHKRQEHSPLDAPEVEDTCAG